MVSAAGSPVLPPQLLCMFLPVHPAAQTPYLCLSQCSGKICLQAASKGIMEALAQLLCLLLLWIPDERNMGWFYMSVKTVFMQLDPVPLLGKCN